MHHPALVVQGVDAEFLLAAVDDYAPSAAESHGGRVTIFFPDRHRRDAARKAVVREWPEAVATPREIDDEDWAQRSQANLPPVTVGRLTVLPAPPALPALPGLPGLPALPAPPALPALVIAPSTGFGTGHHATTRLCLAALQTLDLSDRLVLDVGTGSGILAIAARVLGARAAIGIDDDPDAIRAARENLALNPLLTDVTFRVADVNAGSLPAADVILANLTGALLQRTAPTLLAALRPHGRLIVSGLLREERDAVVRAFEDATLVQETGEDEWAGLIFDGAR